jgi:hypothetical protein
VGPLARLRIRLKSVGGVAEPPGGVAAREILPERRGAVLESAASPDGTVAERAARTPASGCTERIQTIATRGPLSRIDASSSRAAPMLVARAAPPDVEEADVETSAFDRALAQPGAG